VTDSGVLASGPVGVPGRVSMRRCAGCREVAPRAELLRLVCDPGGRVLPDPQRRAPGRGLNVHGRQPCLERATAPRALVRAFRRPGPFDLQALDQLRAGAEAGAVTPARTRCQNGRAGTPSRDDHVEAGLVPADTDAEAGRRVMDAR
jgi:predicted RNA-binding protein YlxR (DUF448 family)